MTDSTSDALFLVQGCWKVLYVINTLSSAFKACAGSKKNHGKENHQYKYMTCSFFVPAHLAAPVSETGVNVTVGNCQKSTGHSMSLL